MGKSLAKFSPTFLPPSLCSRAGMGSKKPRPPPTHTGVFPNFSKEKPSTKTPPLLTKYTDEKYTYHTVFF